jgi:hypothetical protein
VPAGRYRWSRISPALLSYDSHLPSKKRLENTFYKNVAQEKKDFNEQPAHALNAASTTLLKTNPNTQHEYG